MARGAPAASGVVAMSLVLLLLMALAGAGVVRLAWGAQAGIAARCIEAGGGFLLGFVLLGALLEWFGDALLAELRWPGLFALLAVGVAGWGMARRFAASAEAYAAMPTSAARTRPGLAEALLLAALALLGAALALQAMALPTLPWDGWNAWLAKSRAWSEAGRLLPMVPLAEWLQQPPGSAATVAGAVYPEAVPRAVAWLLAWEGGWNEGVAHRPWWALWCALGLLCFGGLRSEGLSTQVAALASLLLLGLPLVTAHVAMAGYADLWLASMILLAVICLLRFERRRDFGSLALLLLCLALLPRIKVEGAIYALLLAVAWGLWRLPPRWRWATVAVAALLPLALWQGLVLHLPVPGLGWAVLGWGEVQIPVIGTLALHWRPVGPAVLNALFVLPSFSVLWYLALSVPLLRWRRLQRTRLASSMGFLVAAGAFHFVLFFFTDAAAWAENLTSLNRLLLHGVPAWVLMLSLLLAEPLPPREQRYGRFATLPR